MAQNLVSPPDVDQDAAPIPDAELALVSLTDPIQLFAKLPKGVRRRVWASAEERKAAVAALVQRRSALDEGEIALFHEIFPYFMTSHRAVVWRVFSRCGLQEQDALDLYQSTFITFFVIVVSSGFPANIPGYLVTIAKYKVLPFLRDLAADPVSLGLPASSEQKPRSSQPDVERIVADWELAQRVLPALGEEQRKVFVMVALHRLSDKSVAEKLGIPLGTVKSRFMAAKKALRELVEPYLSPSQRGCR